MVATRTVSEVGCNGAAQKQSRKDASRPSSPIRVVARAAAPGDANKREHEGRRVCVAGLARAFWRNEPKLQERNNRSRMVRRRRNSRAGDSAAALASPLRNIWAVAHTNGR